MKINKIGLWVVIVVLAIAVFYVAFKGSISTGQISSVGQAAQSASSGMVGGC